MDIVSTRGIDICKSASEVIPIIIYFSVSPVELNLTDNFIINAV